MRLMDSCTSGVMQKRKSHLGRSRTGGSLPLPPRSRAITTRTSNRLVFKAHIRLYHSTLGLRVMKKKRREEQPRAIVGGGPAGAAQPLPPRSRWHPPSQHPLEVATHPPSLRPPPVGPPPAFGFPLTLDAVYVYVAPWSEFPIVPSYPHYPHCMRLGFRVYGSWFGVEGLGLRVEGLGLRM